eukprot:CAMPEP_0178724692 /NCGR_PEP_ID=MMETSP0699-20121125/26243_1 /TAXON_ID=265572 /ORGANISM="Extubocellulus spinifer, Strain CCMP396" /LENGTH=45 /DNA_ID= /DNA_START= /DNA_END= /DNA_ORIENTATION=
MTGMLLAKVTSNIRFEPGVSPAGAKENVEECICIIMLWKPAMMSS